MPHLNFPHQINDLVKFRKILHVAKEVIDSKRALNDDNLGYDCLRKGLYPSRTYVGLPIEEQIHRYKGLSRSDQGPLTWARDVRRTFQLFGLLEEIDGRFRVSKRGAVLTQTPFDNPFTQEEKKAWLDGLANLRFYNAADAETTNSDFRVRPFLLMLELLSKEGELENKLLVFAMTAIDESDTERSRIQALIKSINLGELSFEEGLSKVGLTVPNAKNNVKILPTIGIQLGVIERIGGRLRITPSGKAFYEREIQKTPVWYKDLQGTGIARQCATAVLLSIKNGDIPVDVITKLINESGSNLPEVLSVLSNGGIQIETTNDKLHLTTSISFDLYQDMPSHVKSGEVFTPFISLIELGEVEEEVEVIGPTGTERALRRIPVVRRRRQPTRRTIQNREDLIRGGEEESEAEVDVTRLEQARELRMEKTREHQDIVMAFYDLYKKHSLASDTNNFDLLVEKGDVVFLHEMKTLSETNERVQIVKGIGQLFYYERLELPVVLSNPKARIIKALVFQRALSDSTHIDFLKSLGIEIFWLGENGKIEGESTSLSILTEFLTR